MCGKKRQWTQCVGRRYKGDIIYASQPAKI